MTDAATALLDCRGIERSFAAVRALRGADFSVRAGRVHGLVGENGAGKSTLTKMLAGLYPPDAGTIALDGRPLELRGTDDAPARGIVTVHQDINLIPTQIVAENILLANEPTPGPLGVARMGEIWTVARYLPAREGAPARRVDLVADRGRGPAGAAPDPRSGGAGHRHRVHLPLSQRGVRGLRRDHRTARRCGGAGRPDQHHQSAERGLGDDRAPAGGHEPADGIDAIGRAAARSAWSFGSQRTARRFLHAPQGRDPGDHGPHRLGPDRAGQGDLRQPRHAPRRRVGRDGRSGAEPA